MTRLPILMYHNIVPQKGTGLTIGISEFESQLQYLSKKGYQSVSVANLIKPETKLSKKTVVITFDDVYENQLLYAVPLLEKYNFKATFFIPFSFIGKKDDWNTGKEQIMTIAQLKELTSRGFELAHHSFTHPNFKTLTEVDLISEFQQSTTVIKQNQLQVTPAVAYPYGKFPKDNLKFNQFSATLRSQGIVCGFRIGNRVNKLPFQNLFTIQRLDIKGEDSMFTFARKVKLGKVF